MTGWLAIGLIYACVITLIWAADRWIDPNHPDDDEEQW